MSVGIINKQIEERASLQKNFLKTANMLFGKDWNELTKEELYSVDWLPADLLLIPKIEGNL